MKYAKTFFFILSKLNKFAFKQFCSLPNFSIPVTVFESRQSYISI